MKPGSNRELNQLMNSSSSKIALNRHKTTQASTKLASYSNVSTSFAFKTLDKSLRPQSSNKLRYETIGLIDSIRERKVIDTTTLRSTTPVDQN